MLFIFSDLHSFAYIEFSDRDSVQSAIGLHETLFRGRVLKVRGYYALFIYFFLLTSPPLEDADFRCTIMPVRSQYICCTCTACSTIRGKRSQVASDSTKITFLLGKKQICTFCTVLGWNKVKVVLLRTKEKTGKMIFCLVYWT